MPSVQNFFSHKFFKPLLFGVSLVYEILVLARLFAYRKGWLKTHRPDTPVISVGNLTMGGAGKTPVVDFLVRELQQQKKHPAILSRGYGRENESAILRLRFSESAPSESGFFGDEPYLLALRNPDVAVYVGKSRMQTSRLAEIWDHPDVFVLDDAYQHLAIHRDLNLLLIDAERGLGNRYLLPLGGLREPEHHWNRADAIILTKADLGFSDAVFHLLKHELKVTCPIFKFGYEPQKLFRLDGQLEQSIPELKGARLLLTSGIAQPAGFARSLERYGAVVIETMEFPDHHDYTSEDAQKMLKKYEQLQLAADVPADFWLTTEKDAVKLRCFPELEEKLWVVEMGVRAEKDWDIFFAKFLCSVTKK